MAIPTTAKALGQPLDPADILDFAITLSKEGQTTEVYPLLQADENVASYTLSVTPEGVAAGLRIKTTGGYATSLVGLLLTFWLDIDPLVQTDPMFNAGVTGSLELTINTDSTPPRKKQRTVTVQVKQQ